MSAAYRQPGGRPHTRGTTPAGQLADKRRTRSLPPVVFEPDDRPAWADAIVRLRRSKGYSQLDLAGELEVEVRTVSRWETGANRPQPSQVRGICRVFAVPPEALCLVDSDPVDRRAFVKSLTAGGVLALGGDIASMLGHARVDRAHLDDLARATDDFGRRSHTESPPLLLPAVHGHMAGVMAMVAVPQRDSVDRELRSIAGQTARLAGWLAYLMNNHSQAIAYYDQASELARTAGDGQLDARVKVARSLLYSAIPHLHGAGAGQAGPMALNMLVDALHQAGPTAPARFRSWVHERMAEELAVSGRIDEARMHLDYADGILGAGSPIGESLPGGWDQVWLAAYRGTCERLAGRPEDAIPHFLEALEATPIELAYDRCSFLTQLGAAHAMAGDLDVACGCLGEAHDLAVRHRLAGREQRVHGVRRTLLPGDDPHVYRLDERLAAATA